MLYATHNVSARTLLKLAAVLLLLLAGGLGAAFAAAPPVVPQLIPYTNVLVTGSYTIAGYGGDNNLATGATINGPQDVAIDSAGNVYIADAPNDVIREINAQTGFIQTVAGVDPSSCTGITCAIHTAGCSDGVPALGNPIGSASVALALDAYSNLYFVDTTTETVSVIYRGGTQVANFIKLVNPAGVTASGGSVKVGYVYHVAGTINLSSCTGYATNTNATKPPTTVSNPTWNVVSGSSNNFIGDNQLAFFNNASNTATFGPTFATLSAISLDSAGNIWLGDSNNQTIRVINTQSTAQSFFLTAGDANNSVPVPPGFIRAVVDCGPYTQTCAALTTPYTELGTGVNEPAGTANMTNSGNSINSGQEWMSVDAYGNVLQNATKGANNGVFGISVAYAGGSVMANMIANANSGNSSTSGTNYIAGLSGTPATIGDYYWLTQSETIRPSSAFLDKAGNIYYYDNHYPELFRYDAYAQPNTGQFLNYSGVTEGGTGPGNNHARADTGIGPGTPFPCYAGGTVATPTSTITAAGFSEYFTTVQGVGLGCPSDLTYTGGSGAAVPDGAGNVWIADKSDDLVSKLLPNNQFPAVPLPITGSTTAASAVVTVSSTAGLTTGMLLSGAGIPVGDNIYLVGVGTVTLWQPATATASNIVLTPAVEQSIELHFDRYNLPSLAANTKFPNTASGISIVSAIPDFTISQNETQFTTSGTAYAELAGNQTSASTSASAQLLGNPVCINTEQTNNGNIDCLVNVIFTPTAPGLRQAELSVVTNFTGGTTPVTETYTFGLTGSGLGGLLAIDGGAQSTAYTSTASTPAVALAPTGTMYIADPGNNRIVVCPPASSGTCTTPTSTITTVLGTALKAPMGVALDAAGNVYISDTGNNRIVEVNTITGAQSLLGQILASSTSPQFGPAYTQYAFKAPQGIAVDLNGNVYVADTGNKAVVEIPNNPVLGGATPMLQYPGAPTFGNPVAVAVDGNNNVYVADTTAHAIVELAPGGGDLINVAAGGLITNFNLGSGFVNGSPNGVAVDGAGNVYISDTGTGSGTAVVTVVPSAGAPGGTPYALAFTGLNGPAGLAIDQGGNVYVADSGNNRVLYENRQSPMVQFGTVAQSQASASTPLCPTSGSTTTPCVVTITNVGTQAVALSTPFSAITATSPANDAAFSLTAGASPAIPLCSSEGGLLPAGANCAITPTFLPTSDGAQTATVSINNGAKSFSLVANGAQPFATVTLTNTPTTGTGTAGTAVVVTATVTQTHLTGVTPSGTVTFSYTANGVSGGAATQVTMSGGTASYTIPASAVLQGHTYVVTATYSGDALNTAPPASALTIQVAGQGVTATATPITFTYGSAPPAITGTVTGIPSADASTLKYTFSTPATASTAPGTYPIYVTFSGAADAATYGYGAYPTVYATGSTTVAATAIESPAALSVTVNNITATYGAPPVAYTSTITGQQNGDNFTEAYTPSNSQILNVGTYPIVPSFAGDKSANYKITITNGKLTVVQASTQISVGQPSNVTADGTLGAALDYILGVGTLASTTYYISPNPATNLSSAIYTFTVTSAVGGGIGTPTGSVYVSDTFTPFTTTGSGMGTVVPGCTPTVTTGCTAMYPVALTSGVGTFAASGMSAGTTPGLHVLTIYYTSTPTKAGTSGDSNFLASSTVAAPVALIVDSPAASATWPTVTGDFVVQAESIVSSTLTTAPVQVTPGAIPGSSSGQAQVSVTPFQNFTGTVYLGCTPQSPAYVTCTINPNTITAPTTYTGAAVTTTANISTPQNLPIGFNFGSSVAFIPLGLLAFCVRRRRKLSSALWILIGIVFVSVGMVGCADNSEQFYVPIPTGPQTVTIYACSVQASCTNPITGNGASGSTVSSAGLIRSYNLTININ